MNPTPSNSDVASIIQKGVQDLVTEIVAKETEEAKKRVEVQVRKLIPQVAAAVFNRFTFERPFGPEQLSISVDFRTGNPLRQ